MKRTPITRKRQLAAHGQLERAKLQVQFAQTPAARRRAMEQVERLRRELGMGVK